ncbi:MAG: aldehyde dehydrogenase family protein [Gammaproteobacteria bacterium]|jgi:aldehyde dehydrogenase (NAD+)|nr:aldehyde dehydrogenase family protein [Gammaproteobacteria bacterium]
MQVYDKFYIGGKWVAPKGKGKIEVIDPSTEEVCGVVPSGNAEDINAAVAAAKEAFKTWSRTTAAERSELIGKIAEKFTASMPKIGEICARELGTPLQTSIAVHGGLGVGVMSSFKDIPFEMEKEERIGNSLIIKEPIGVCGFITPWNFPLHQLVAKLAPALAAGCTVVVKPSSDTPLTAYWLAETLHEVGLPAGVFNLVSGPGRSVGEAMCTHPDVDMVSITGSTEAGIRVAELAAGTVKRVGQELGGKSPMVVLEDADVAKAAAGAAGGICMNSGQVCAALSRLIVPRGKQDEAVKAAKAAAEAVVVGGAFDEGVTMGPVASKAQFDSVRAYIQKGIDEGATLVTGGLDMPAGKNTGYFVKPTIFADVRNDMTIAQEEIFGPVLCIIPYDSEQEAIDIANDSIFGLSGAVVGGTQERAIEVAKQIRTGQLSINGGAFNVMAPFGGYKQSGNGRELGPHGLAEYIELKAMQL